MVGIAALAMTAFAARSVALAGFGLDSLIEICACNRRILQPESAGQG